VYDITRRESFEHVQNWIEDCKNQTPKTVLLVLVGNKTDLESERKISTEEGKQMAERHNMLFYETSARNGKGVHDMFDSTVHEIATRINDGFYDLKSDNCGIKMGTNALDRNVELYRDKHGKGNKKKGCC
jgi:Ras-related protein Rab-2A